MNFIVVGLSALRKKFTFYIITLRCSQISIHLLAPTLQREKYSHTNNQPSQIQSRYMEYIQENNVWKCKIATVMIG